MGSLPINRDGLPGGRAKEACLHSRAGSPPPLWYGRYAALRAVSSFSTVTGRASWTEFSMRNPQVNDIIPAINPSPATNASASMIIHLLTVLIFNTLSISNARAMQREFIHGL